MVTKNCPRAMMHAFPDLFDASGASRSPALQLLADTLAPSLDNAPEGCKFFVYPRQRGEQPLCRLEMKFPRQKEVFYLRHMLLNFPKLSFDDCFFHAGRKHASYEAAITATGLFAADDEAHAVLDELVALRYTATQLRFAFLLLLEQKAKPIALYHKYERQLMNGYLSRRMSQDNARILLQTTLRASWLQPDRASSQSHEGHCQAKHEGHEVTERP